MSKNTKITKVETTETKAADTVEVKTEAKVKVPTEKQNMLAAWKQFVATRKAFNEKFNPNFPALHLNSPEFIDEVAKALSDFTAKIDSLIAETPKVDTAAA